MALLIQKDLNILGGLSTSNLYLRFGYKLDFSGTEVIVNIQKYINKNSYSNNTPINGLYIEGIPDNMFLSYNRSEDGIDILSYIHNKVKDELSTDKTILVPISDPSTGELQYDPSTGEILKESVISISKFADESEITIVDLDPSIG